MSEDDADDRREYFRIKDRLAIEVRAISDEEFLQLENTIRYNPTQVIDKAYDMHFLKESISNDEKEKSQILSYLVMIDKVAATPKGYPRKVGVPARRPL